jgi:hypothetical protein
MGTNTAIPLTTLPPGETVLGPVTVPAGLLGGTLSIDRTVPGGLNSLADTSTVTMTWDESFDGGTSWNNLGVTPLTAGVIVHLGVTQTTGLCGVSLSGLGPGRQLRLTADVSGPSPVAVAGSLTTTP